ncbi:phosphoribosyl-AMP cyclohydrolase [Propionibacterium freudenreichii]|uniref:phosphoribosyl-AMP cyclohydrolase n=1 Tax=Propionibacterium freudenreichii TaxID=1744 RepID=UPI0038519A47
MSTNSARSTRLDASAPTQADSGVPTLDPSIAQRLKRNEAGLVPAIAQEATSGRVLMMAWMNDDALARTLATRKATYWSRSRQELWVKGETSGHTQAVRDVWLDCDGDTVLLSVDQVGAACHTGADTCFDAGGPLPLAAESVIAS